MTNATLLLVSSNPDDDPTTHRAVSILADALGSLGVGVRTALVASRAAEVAAALNRAVAEADVVITVGGTSVRPGECVVDVTQNLPMVELPGMAEEIRRRGAARTPAALVSRGVCGVVDADGRPVVVINSPSSRGGARDVADVLTAVLDHLLADLAGDVRV